MYNKKLAQEILKRVEAEQVLRKAQVSGKAKRSEYKKLDRQNTTWLKTVFREFGLPTHSLAGKKALKGMFLMIRHADHDRRFQQEALRRLRKVCKKDSQEAPCEEIAYLTDRLLANAGKSIEYGTLYDVNGLDVKPKPTRDAKNVDKRRKEIGIRTTVEGRRRALIRELKSLGAKTKKR